MDRNLLKHAMLPQKVRHAVYLVDEGRWVTWTTERDKKADIYLYGRKYLAYRDSGENGVVVHYYVSA